MNNPNKIVKFAIAVKVWAIESISNLSDSIYQASLTILKSLKALKALIPPPFPYENPNSINEVSTTKASNMLNLSLAKFQRPMPTILKKASNANIAVKK